MKDKQPNYYHDLDRRFCLATGGYVTGTIWTDHSRPKSFNSCEHCKQKPFDIGNTLHDLNEKRKAKQEAK